AAGLLLGAGLGRGLVQLVSRAVTDLYFVVSVRQVAVPPEVLGRGAALGLAAAVLSSLPAAREAARTAPRVALLRSALEQHARERVPLLAGVGLVLAGLAGARLGTAGRNAPPRPRARADRRGALPGVAEVGTARGVTVQRPDGPLFLSALDLARGRGPRLLAGEAAKVWPAFFEGGAVLVSEPFAYKR